MLGHLNQENDFHYNTNQDKDLDKMISSAFAEERKNSTGRKIAKGAFTLGAGLVMLASSYNCNSGPLTPPIAPTGVVQFYFANDLKKSVYSLPIDFDVSGSAKTISISASPVPGAYSGAIYVWNRSKDSSFVVSDKTSGNVNVNVKPSDALVAVVLNTKSGLNYAIAVPEGNGDFDFGFNPVCTFENRNDQVYHLDRTSSDRVIGFISESNPYFKPTLGANGNISFGGGDSHNQAGTHFFDTPTKGRAEASKLKAQNPYATLCVELIELFTHSRTNPSANTLDLAGIDGKPTPQGVDFICLCVMNYLSNNELRLPN